MPPQTTIRSTTSRCRRERPRGKGALAVARSESHCVLSQEREEVACTPAHLHTSSRSSIVGVGSVQSVAFKAQSTLRLSKRLPLENRVRRARRSSRAGAGPGGRPDPTHLTPPSCASPPARHPPRAQPHAQHAHRCRVRILPHVDRPRSISPWCRPALPQHLAPNPKARHEIKS